MSDTEPGVVERMVNRAMYVRSVSDGMDEIDKLFAEARAHDAEDAKRDAEFADNVALFEERFHELERLRAVLRQAREALSRMCCPIDDTLCNNSEYARVALVTIDALKVSGERCQDVIKS